MVNQPSSSRAKDAGDDGESEFAKRLTIPETAPLLTPKEGRAFLSMDLNQVQRLSFNLGHVINDITGVLWFSYALLFFQFIVHLSSTTSAALLFLGKYIHQLCIGIVCNFYNPRFKRGLGKRTPDNHNLGASTPVHLAGDLFFLL